ncbi:MAG: hypothetical protein NZ828_09530 [Alphaproteobacteria bacterium]|nr:hypothetical protein [Alphaproteobacteria bacterium]
MDDMQGQDIKHATSYNLGQKSLWTILLSLCLLFSTVSYANVPHPIKRPNVPLQNFYDEWVNTQRGTIPDLKQWADTYFDARSKIRFDITAKIPALLDYDFHKTIKVDAKDAEKHLIQWLNIHKHSALDYKIITAQSDENGTVSEVQYTAHGVTVLPQGRHKTIRMKTDLDITCHDTLTPPPIKIISSNCEMRAESIPLKQRGQ